MKTLIYKKQSNKKNKLNQKRKRSSRNKNTKTKKRNIHKNNKQYKQKGGNYAIIKEMDIYLQLTEKFNLQILNNKPVSDYIKEHNHNIISKEVIKAMYNNLFISNKPINKNQFHLYDFIYNNNLTELQLIWDHGVNKPETITAGKQGYHIYVLVNDNNNIKNMSLLGIVRTL